MMNCDQAFDVMTDPSVAESAMLDAHLGDCPRCRQMYETLSPALGLFDRAVDSVDSITAGPMTATSVDLAERVAARLTKPSPAERRPSRRGRRFAVIVAMTFLGFLTGLGLAAFVPTSPGSTSGLASECAWVNRSAQPLTSGRSDAVVLSCVACHLSSPAE